MCDCSVLYDLPTDRPTHLLTDLPTNLPADLKVYHEGISCFGPQNCMPSWFAIVLTQMFSYFSLYLSTMRTGPDINGFISDPKVVLFM